MTGYTQAQQSKGQRAMIQEGVFVRIMEGFTGGVILAGFALALGATDLEIGLIASIPFFAQLAHIPAVAILERFPDRRVLTVGGSALARMLFFPMALLPLVELPIRPVHALVPLLILYATIATFSGAAWQVWIRELVPRETLGRYFARRLGVLSAVGLVTILLAGQFVAFYGADGAEVVAFSALFIAGGLSGLVSSVVLSRAPSLRAPPARPAPIADVLRRPFEDRNYRRVLVFLGAWGFAANIALPFVSVVLLRVLGYGVGIVTILAALSSLANILALRFWGPASDRFGNKPVLGLSAGVFLLAMTVWLLTDKTPGMMVLFAAGLMHVLLGVALAGLDVAGHNVVLKLAPEREAPSYLAAGSVVKALAAGIAPLLGGVALTLLAGREFRMQFVWASPAGESVATALRFVPHDFLFLASVLLGLYAVHRLLGFHEEGEAPQEEVVRALRREVVQPTSVAGMRAFAHLASYLVEAGWKFERAIERRRETKKRSRGGSRL